MERIHEAGAGFRSLTEAIDTTTAPGRMMMQMVGAFAEFERAILRERTMAGLDAARKRGRIEDAAQSHSRQQRDEIVSTVSRHEDCRRRRAAFQRASGDSFAAFGQCWCRYYRGMRNAKIYADNR